MLNKLFLTGKKLSKNQKLELLPSNFMGYQKHGINHYYKKKITKKVVVRNWITYKNLLIEGFEEVY